MGTHINAYQEEATVALAKVRDALGEAESKLEALVAKVNEKSTGDQGSAPVKTPETASAKPSVKPTKKKS